MGTESVTGEKNRTGGIIENEILKYISAGIRNALLKSGSACLGPIEEIRIRASKPVMLHNYKEDMFLAKDGGLHAGCSEKSYFACSDDIQKSLELMSENSIYAYQDEIRNGFITLKGGHRVGIAGKAVLEGANIKNLRDISSLNIRIAREIPGCSMKTIKYLINGKSNIYNTLIISPPQCGKTTILRDIAKNLSNGIESLEFRGVKVGIVDERAELAACWRGVPQNDIGLRSDVLDGCPKASGIMMLLRSMSPQVVITDEIGNRGDFEAVMRAVNSGVSIITTVHGNAIADIKCRQEISELLENRIFERYVLLNSAEGPGTLQEVIDGSTLRKIYLRSH